MITSQTVLCSAFGGWAHSHPTRQPLGLSLPSASVIAFWNTDPVTWPGDHISLPNSCSAGALLLHASDNNTGMLSAQSLLSWVIVIPLQLRSHLDLGWNSSFALYGRLFLEPQFSIWETGIVFITWYLWGWNEIRSMTFLALCLVCNKFSVYVITAIHLREAWLARKIGLTPNICVVLWWVRGYFFR